VPIHVEKEEYEALVYESYNVSNLGFAGPLGFSTHFPITSDLLYGIYIVLWEG
jgi:hypothetical protein